MESGTPCKKMRLAPSSAPSTPYHATSPASSSSALSSRGSLTAKPRLTLTPEQQARISANREAALLRRAMLANNASPSSAPSPCAVTPRSPYIGACIPCPSFSSDTAAATTTTTPKSYSTTGQGHNQNHPPRTPMAQISNNRILSPSSACTVHRQQQGEAAAQAGAPLKHHDGHLGHSPPFLPPKHATSPSASSSLIQPLNRSLQMPNSLPPDTHRPPPDGACSPSAVGKQPPPLPLLHPPSEDVAMAMGVQVDRTAPSSSFFSASAGRAQVGQAGFKPQQCREGEGGGVAAAGEHSVQGSRALQATSQPRANQVTAHQPTDQETNKPTDQMAGEAAKEVSDPPTNQADDQSTDQATSCPRHLADLNEHQRRAASHSTTSPLLILAGAGSGKTKTMMARIVHFIRSGVAPHQVLGLTFSTAACKEMKARIKKVLPSDQAKMVTFSTFHALALKVCREHASELGLGDDFAVLTGRRQRWIVHHAITAIEEAGQGGSAQASGGGQGGDLEAQKGHAKRALQQLVQAQAKGLKPDQVGGDIGSVMRYYEDAMERGKTLDFPSIIRRATQVLLKLSERGEGLETCYTHVLVDEFQDTTRAQFEFVDAVVGKGCVTVVGDDDQTIYAFQGSRHENFDLFRKRYPGVNEVRLVHNYRSTAVIVDAARSLIEHNSSRAAKHSVAHAQGGDLIRVVDCRDDKCEVKWTCSEVVTAKERGEEYKDMAILYRTKKVGKELQAELRSAGIPFNEHGVSFWRRKIVKHVVSALRIVACRGDDEACRKLLKAFLYGDKTAQTSVITHIEKATGCGERGCMWDVAKEILTAKVSGALSKKNVAMGRRMISTVESLSLHARSSPSLPDFVPSVIQALPNPSHFDANVADEDGSVLLNEPRENRTLRTLLLHKIQGLLDEADDQKCRSSGGLSGCEAQIRVFLDTQLVEEARDNRTIREDNKNSVTLSTVHQSKGLEFTRVFIVRCMNGEMPLTNSANTVPSKAAMEDERRLMYVAMTRAKKYLTISHPSRLRGYPVSPSPFLSELPPVLLRRMQVDDMPRNKTLEGDAGGGGQGDAARGGNEEETEAAALPLCDAFFSCGFIKRFDECERATISLLFHKWARKAAFSDAPRLLAKVKGVIADKMGSKSCKSKPTLHRLLRMLSNPTEGTEEKPTASPAAFALEVLAFESAPEHIKQQHRAASARHFQGQGASAEMQKRDPSPKQLAFLKSLGCTAAPKTMMEASALIEKFKKI